MYPAGLPFYLDISRVPHYSLRIAKKVTNTLSAFSKRVTDAP